MPTVLDLEPKVKDFEASVAAPPVKPPTPVLRPLPERRSQPAIFSDCLLETDSPEMRRRGLATTFSFIFECVLLGFLLIVPLMFTEALPTQQLLTFLIAPPPPPPPPPPAAVQVAKVVQTNVLNNGQLRTPTRIPQKVEMIREAEAPPPMDGGVVGGVPGGIPGGQLGGVIGGIISANSNATITVPKLEPVKRVRISQGVSQGMLVVKVEPDYPRIALAARVTGVVVLKAVIDVDGNIKELQVISGHPVLVPAAIDAVKRWHYRPYLLNGTAIEVETNVTVTFQISN